MLMFHDTTRIKVQLSLAVPYLCFISCGQRFAVSDRTVLHATVLFENIENSPMAERELSALQLKKNRHANRQNTYKWRKNPLHMRHFENLFRFIRSQWRREDEILNRDIHVQHLKVRGRPPGPNFCCFVTHFYLVHCDYVCFLHCLSVFVFLFLFSFFAYSCFYMLHLRCQIGERVFFIFWSFVNLHVFSKLQCTELVGPLKNLLILMRELSAVLCCSHNLLFRLKWFFFFSIKIIPSKASV